MKKWFQFEIALLIFSSLFFQNCGPPSTFKSLNGTTKEGAVDLRSSVGISLQNISTSTMTSNSTSIPLTFPLTLVPSSIEVSNPLKGYYQFSPTSPLPTGMFASDVYFRFSWDKVETALDVYDFTVIENQLKNLKQGQRLGLRVMPLNTCCASETPLAADVPDYLMAGDTPSVSRVGTHGWYYTYLNKLYFIPDWNDAYVLARMEKLVQKLAEKYDGDPRIGWFEIGLYGNWGEWHTYPLLYPNDSLYLTTTDPVYLFAPADTANKRFRPGTAATKDRILLAHTNAFTKTQLISLSADLPYLVKALNIAKSKPIGFRRDSWGAFAYTNLEMYQSYKLTNDDVNLIFNRWKIAPYLTESWGYAHSKEISNTMNVLQQIQFFHASAIAYMGFSPPGGFQTLSVSDQNLFLAAGIQAGYRYVVSSASFTYLNNVVTFSSTWQNRGLAPTYDDWQVLAYLYDRNSQSNISVVGVPVQLKTLYNTSPYSIEIANLIKSNTTSGIQDSLNRFYAAPYNSQTFTVNIPADYSNLLMHSSIELRVKVKDRRNYLLPMRLGNTGRNADGSYTLYTLK